jgi:hypothetical protein
VTLVAEVKEEEQLKEQPEPADQVTLVAEVNEEQLQEPEAADNPIPVADMKEEEQQKELEPTDDPTLVANVKEEGEKQKEPESKPAGDELIPVVEGKEEQQKEPEDAQEDDDSEAPKFDVISNGVHKPEVKAAEPREEVDTKNEIDDDEEEVSLTAGDELAKAVANGLEKFVESTMPNDMSETVVEAVELVDDEAALPEEVNRESLQVAGQGGDITPSIEVANCCSPHPRIGPLQQNSWRKLSAESISCRGAINVCVTMVYVCFTVT